MKLISALVKGNVQNISACKELTKCYDAVTCPILKFAKGVAHETSFVANLPASWSAVALLQSGTYVHSTSNLFPLCCSSNDFTRSPSVPHKCQTTVPILILPFKSWGLFTCARATRILATGSIRERQLFCSARPEVWRLIESDVWSSKYSIWVLLIIKALNDED